MDLPVSPLPLDSDIAFAEGQFYLVTQTRQDFVSPGPWVETVEVHVGRQRWHHQPRVGLAGGPGTLFPPPGVRETNRAGPRGRPVSGPSRGLWVRFEIRATDTTGNASTPILDKVHVHTEGGEAGR